MVPAATPVSQEVVLVGGGHSHALVLRMLGMRPWPGTQVTLVSDVSHAPYSGMLPGHLAGVYSWEETHIDLRRLCAWAGARFIHAAAAGLDLPRKQLQLHDRPPLGFDVVSINIGSTPSLGSVPGAAACATPAKPVPLLLEKWEALVAAAADGRHLRVVIVGAGAGGVEVALSLKARLGAALTVSLVHQGTTILPTHNPGVRRHLQTALHQAGVTVLTGQPVTAVHPSAVDLQDGSRLEADAVIWTTHAAAPPWLRTSGLALDDHGFIAVDTTLRSLSHSFVFAAGDCASVLTAARPKSGVFAVRAARPLFTNLGRWLDGRSLKPWRPQSQFLGLIGTGSGRAVVSRGRWTAEGAWAWQWKDRIDRAFMRRFSELPPMDRTARVPDRPRSQTAAAALERKATMRCLGCAGKVGGSILHRVLVRLRATHPAVVCVPPDRSDIMAGLDAPDDAAVFLPPPGRPVVQTIDHLSALVTDPFIFGRIAALHGMSDIVAMGAEPHSALVTALVPFAAESVTEEWLTQLLGGVATELGRMGALLLGGHTAEAPAAALTLACTGLAGPSPLWRKNGLLPGQTLILTKPLGTGTLFAAAMRHAAQGRWIDAAIASMLVPNQPAARLAHTHGATAATDITGFGLLGHLGEMTRASNVAARLDLDSLPILPGAAACAALGLLSSLHEDNARLLDSVSGAADLTHHPHFPLLSDPQTSGGLLLAIDPSQAPALLEALRSGPAPSAAIIGSTQAPDPGESSLLWLDSGNVRKREGCEI